MAISALVKSMLGSSAPKAKSGTSAMSGIAARSWNSSTEKASRPCRVVSSPFSSSTCSAKAVEDSESASPMKSACAKGSPSAMPITARTAAVTASCAVPSPKIAERMAHSRTGRSSSPITNSSITTPNSPKWRNSPDIVEGIERAEHVRPDDDAGGEIAEHRAHAQGCGRAARRWQQRPETPRLESIVPFPCPTLALAVLGSTLPLNPLAGSGEPCIRPSVPARGPGAMLGA